MSIPEGAPFCIREVWSFNLQAEFELIRSVLAMYPYVSIDTEFPGVVLKPNPNSSASAPSPYAGNRAGNNSSSSSSSSAGGYGGGDEEAKKWYNPGRTRGGYGSSSTFQSKNRSDSSAPAPAPAPAPASTATYRTMKVNVDRMKLIQVGLTFMDGEGELPKLSDGTYCAWQFNFRGFDPEEDIYEPSSIALLRSCGIDFAKNRMLGVDPGLFREKLLSCGLLCNRRVHYICFHGAYDFAYLLKLITCASLPADEASFLLLLRHYFGTFYDLKYMQIRLLNLHGGLEKLARSLGIKRIGPSHQAGSDSLLTSSSFQRMKDLCFLDHCQDFSGVLFGLRALPKPKPVY